MVKVPHKTHNLVISCLVVALQRKATPKCTKMYNVRAEPLLSQLS